jgi:hypothetical protein
VELVGMGGAKPLIHGLEAKLRADKYFLFGRSRFMSPNWVGRGIVFSSSWVIFNCPQIFAEKSRTLLHMCVARCSVLEGIFGAFVLAFFCWSGPISWLIGRLPLKDAVSAEQETNDRKI